MQFALLFCFLCFFTWEWVGEGGGAEGKGERGEGGGQGEEEGRKVTFCRSLYLFCFIFQFAKHIVQENLFA